MNASPGAWAACGSPAAGYFPSMAIFPRTLVLVPMAALLCPTPALATVNIEKYRLSPGEDGAAGSLSISLTHKSGNVDYFETGLEGLAKVS